VSREYSKKHSEHGGDKNSAMTAEKNTEEKTFNVYACGTAYAHALNEEQEIGLFSTIYMQTAVIYSFM